MIPNSSPIPIPSSISPSALQNLARTAPIEGYRSSPLTPSSVSPSALENLARTAPGTPVNPITPPNPVPVPENIPTPTPVSNPIGNGGGGLRIPASAGVIAGGNVAVAAVGAAIEIAQGGDATQAIAGATGGAAFGTAGAIAGGAAGSLLGPIGTGVGIAVGGFVGNAIGQSIGRGLAGGLQPELSPANAPPRPATNVKFPDEGVQSDGLYRITITGQTWYQNNKSDISPFSLGTNSSGANLAATIASLINSHTSYNPQNGYLKQVAQSASVTVITPGSAPTTAPPAIPNFPIPGFSTAPAQLPTDEKGQPVAATPGYSPSTTRSPTTAPTSTPAPAPSVPKTDPNKDPNLSPLENNPFNPYRNPGGFIPPFIPALRPTGSPTSAPTINNPSVSGNSAPGKNVTSVPQTGTQSSSSTQLRGSPCSRSGSPCQQSMSDRLDQGNEGIKQANSKLDALNTGINAADFAAMLAGLEDIKARLGPQIPGGGISNFLGKFREGFDKLTEWLHLDRLLNVLTFIVTVQNAYFLTVSLKQVTLQMISDGLNVIGLKDKDGQGLNLNKLLDDSIEGILKSIVGDSTLETMKAEWKALSRIYQAGSNIIFSIQNMAWSILNALEIIGSWNAQIGNALKWYGVVGRKAFEWLNPAPNFHNKFFTAINNSLNVVNNIDMVAQSILSGRQAVDELQKQSDEFQKDFQEVVHPTPKKHQPTDTKNTAAETASKSPSPSDEDILNLDDLGL